MSDKIKIFKEKSNFNIAIGEKTIELINGFSKLDSEEKETLLNESAEILSNCVNPIDTVGEVTGLAVGYVQSGKTMSFTTLTTLAIDNGFRIIIYFAGTKNNLLYQTTNRLKTDLFKGRNSKKQYKIFQNPISDESHVNKISNTLKLKNKPAILITILKKEKYISELSKIFGSVEIKLALGNNGVLIIDDEADQASLNTFARSNSKSEDWEHDEYSSTYSSILSLKASLPNHSYIQYTATPQGPLLINLMDLLSPDFHVVLTPGKTYTGGKVFFEDKPELIITIPPKEVFHFKNNPLNECPSSLIEALQVYLISVAIQVYIFEKQDFLSMMVHADREKDASKKFFSWVNSLITNWGNRLSLNDSDPSKLELISSFKVNYSEATRLITNPPSFKSVMDQVSEVILDTNIELVVQGASEIDWTNSSSHILIGAEMLNRGYTVEGLTVTYMPRNSASKSNADTIQQRCRFFGYKLSYLESCRVYLPVDSILDYKEYVEHEEVMRSKLKTSTLRDLEQVMILGDQLNPTRNNILSDDIIRNKLSGWRQFNALNHIPENTKIVEDFIKSNEFENFIDYGTENRNHKLVRINIQEAIKFLNEFKVTGMPDAIRKSTTIQYLKFLANKNKINHAYVFYMAPGIVEGRRRELIDHKNYYTINNIFMGRSNDGGISYPGDKGIFKDNSFCIQIHNIRLKHTSSKWDNKQLYTLGVYYPNDISHTMIGIAN